MLVEHRRALYQDLLGQPSTDPAGEAGAPNQVEGLKPEAGDTEQPGRDEEPDGDAGARGDHEIGIGGTQCTQGFEDSGNHAPGCPGCPFPDPMHVHVGQQGEGVYRLHGRPADPVAAPPRPQGQQVEQHPATAGDQEHVNPSPRRPGTPPQVLHLTCQYRPSVGGVERFVEGLCRHLPNHGIGASVLALDRTYERPGEVLPHHEILDGIPVRRVAYRRVGTYFLAPGVLRALGRPDVLHVHNTEFFLDAVPWIRRSLPGVPVLLTPHGGYFHTRSLWRLKQFHFRVVMPRLLAHVERVIAVSVPDERRFQGLVAPEKLLRIPVAVDHHRFRSMRPASSGAGILHLGRYSPNKRIDRLLDLLEDLPAVGPLHLVGDLVGAHADQVIDRIGRGGSLAGRIFAHGFVADADLADIVARCRFVASSSDYEGFGMALVEGMAAGLVPLANAALPSFRELVDPDTRGFLVPFASRSDAAEAVAEAVVATDLAERSAACRRFAAGFDPDAIAAAHASLYFEVLQRRTC